MKKFLFSVMLLAIAGCLHAQATIYVDSANISGTHDGSSWATAYDSLQVAINSASAGNSVFVAKGTYRPTSGQSFSMKEGVKIYGGFAGTEGSLSQRDLAANLIAGDSSILKGNGNSVIDNSTNNLTAAAVLDGFSITSGNKTSNGVGVGGGGMYNSSSSPTLSNCTFWGNTATVVFGGGGGMCNENGSSPTLSNCTFVGNTASMGFIGISSGGGMYNSSSSPTLSNCTFSGNTAGTAAGMDNENGSSAILANCTFSDNTTDNYNGEGGGMLNYSSSAILTNCTFSGNTASGSGGGMYNVGSSTLTNCIFWGNTTGAQGADIFTNGGVLTITYSYTQTAQSGTHNITGSSDPFINSSNPAGADGIFGTADDGLHLNFAAGYFAAGFSPIDAGNNAAISSGDTADIAGATRIQNSTVDMGAYEGQISAQALPVTLSGFSGSLQNGIATLQWQSGVESNFGHYELQESAAIAGDSRLRGNDANGNGIIADGVIPTDGGIPFATIARINAKGSNSSYTYNIPQTETTAYYRLKLVDNDGSSKYSSIVQLSQNGSSSLPVYPNPAHSYINIKVANAGSIHIYDASGRLLETRVLQAGVNRIDVRELDAGAYYGMVNGQQVKFIKE